MQWEGEAIKAINRLPVAKRRKEKARIEAAVLKAGKDIVTLADAATGVQGIVNTATYAADGFRFDVCAGMGECPNRAHRHGDKGGRELSDRVRRLLEAENLGVFLKQSVKGPVRAHHAFRVSFSDCPNACSQPQIRDIGIIAAALPVLTEMACIMCGACENACRENAVWVDADRESSVFDYNRCIACGSCISACPTGKIGAGDSGYRVMIGGKLGRHPRLARELPGIFDAETVMFIIKWCLNAYRQKSTQGRRFADIVAEEGDALMSVLQKAIDNRKQLNTGR